MASTNVMPALLFDLRGSGEMLRFKNSRYGRLAINAIRIYNEKEVDELVFLDISASQDKRSPRFDFVRECASECFMPFSYGGGVSSADDFGKLYRLGVEKVIVNTLALS